MPLNVNGTGMARIFVNGTEMTQVNVNGTKVWPTASYKINTLSSEINGVQYAYTPNENSDTIELVAYSAGDCVLFVYPSENMYITTVSFLWTYNGGYGGIYAGPTSSISTGAGRFIRREGGAQTNTSLSGNANAVYGPDNPFVIQISTNSYNFTSGCKHIITNLRVNGYKVSKYFFTPAYAASDAGSTPPSSISFNTSNNTITFTTQKTGNFRFGIVLSSGTVLKKLEMTIDSDHTLIFADQNDPDNYIASDYSTSLTWTGTKSGVGVLQCRTWLAAGTTVTMSIKINSIPVRV